MARKRFRRDELPLAALGTAIEWRNGSHWHPGVVCGALSANRDGWQYIPITNGATTRTVGKGDLIRATPGAIRAAASA